MTNKLMLFLMLLCLFQNYESSALGNKSTRTKLVIDHDGGADDAMAIFMVLLYEKYFNGPKVLGLMTSYGNVNESQAFINSQRILDVAQRSDVPIYRGSKRSLVTTFDSDYYFGYDGLGDNKNAEFQPITPRKEHAAFAMIELSKTYPGKLIVVAIGPLTNIALAIRLDPDFVGRLAQLYVGAGTVYSAEYSSPEFNAEMDVEAYRIVVESATADKVTIIPFSQIYSSLNISNEWRKDVLGKIPTPVIRAQNSYERISFALSDSWVLLDPAVAGIVLDPNLTDEVKYSNNSIILCGHKRGINTNDLKTKEPNVRLIYSAKKECYKTLLIRIFSAELNQKA